VPASGRAAAIVGILVLVVASAGAATIVVVNQDGAGEGFNDPTPVAPVGGNPGTTRGAQRLAAFQFAADIWAGLLQSGVPIMVDATMDPLPCDATSATLGQAGPTTIHRDFAGALVASTWYPQALANKLAQDDLDPSTDDITAQFSSALGTTCALAETWYYGFDANPPPNTIDFVSVVTHELGHGLGFVTFVDETTGSKFHGIDDAFERNLADGGVAWPDMTDAERAASAIHDGALVWVGASVTAHAGILAAGRDGAGHVEMYAPNPVDPGSSISHWSPACTPNELLEPVYTGPLHDPSLARWALSDMGWDEPSISTTTTTLAGTTTTTTPLACGATPAAGCRDATRSVLALENRANDARDRLAWTWKGDGAAIADLGDPTVSTSMLRLCVYEAGGAGPLVDAEIVGGGRCGRKSCWRRLGGATHPRGYVYQDAAATPDGIVRARAVLKRSGAALIAVGGRGARLGVPPMPLALPVTVDFLVRDATGTRCWQSVAETARVNAGAEFRTR
jgi:hypothetical protein